MALTDKLVAIGDAIREKTNTTEKLTLDEMPGMISSITGGTRAEYNVTFYDWDGKILHQYPKELFETMSALPTPPNDLEGCTCVGWNYSIETIKSMPGSVIVCAIYNQNDDEEEETAEAEKNYVDGTKLHLHIQEAMTIQIVYLQSIVGGVTVKWGDGETSTNSTGYGNSSIYQEHAYEEGEYTITFDILDGCKLTLGINNSGVSVMGGNGNGLWYRTSTLKKAEIDLRNTEINAYAFRYCIGLTDVVIGDGVSQVLKTYAFQSCYALRNVSLSNSITSIGTYAFQYCYRLAETIIPQSVTSINSYAFQCCFSLKKAVISKNVVTIDSYAFSQCYALKDVTICNGVKYIRTYAFEQCRSIRNIHLPNSIIDLQKNAFYNCLILEMVIVPYGITSLINNVFSGCAALEKAIIPNSVTSISSAFTGTALKFIGIPDSVLTISGTFSNDSCLRNVSLGENLTSIGSNTFSSCYALERLIIPPKVTGTFSSPIATECKCLKEVSLPEGMDIGSGMFYRCTFLSELQKEMVETALENAENINPYAFAGESYLEDIALSENAKTIGNYAFAENYALEKVSIPEGVETIGNYAFIMDYGLEDIDFPESILTLSSYSFSQCRSLKEPTITAKSVESNAFSGCSKIRKVTFTKNQTSVGTSSFNACYGLKEIAFSDAVREATISSGAFAGTGIEKMPDFPASTTFNAGSVFASCYSLESFDLSKISIAQNTDQQSMFNYCYSMSEATLNPDVRSIGNYMFNYCYSLLGIKVSKNVTSIGYNAFYNCYNILDIELPLVGATSIGSQAFYGCYRLKKAIIPYTVRTINGSIFSSCYCLSKIYFYPQVPPTGTTAIGSGFPSHYKLYVPKGCLEAYKAQFTSHKEEVFEEFEYMIAYQENKFFRIISVSADSFSIKKPFIHTDFDESQTFTGTYKYNGTNFSRITGIEFDWKADEVTVKFERSEDIVYGQMEDIEITISADGKEGVECTFSAQVMCSEKEIYEEYSVTNVSSAYGFYLNEQNYYQSNNQKVPNSYAVCRVDFQTNIGTLYVDCVGEGEANYDYGILSNLDTELELNNSEGSANNIKRSFRGVGKYEETVEYQIEDEMEHFIYIKYKKDGSADVGEDCLKFKIRFV